MRLPKHCHVNTTIIRRSLFQQIGGLDEGLRYDNDRDFYLRAVDAAGTILYAGRTVARHNIPDQTQKLNLSTSMPHKERLLAQMRVFDRAIALARRPEVADHAYAHKSYVVRHLADALAQERRWRWAAAYAWEALAMRFSLKWTAYCLWLSLRSLAKPNRAA